MNIQIIGHKKCRNTKKALRYFKERNIPYHFKDITEKALSPGELKNITAKIKAPDLVDIEGKTYQRQGYRYREYDPLEEILENPMLLKTPVVRNGTEITAGYVPDRWQAWINSDGPAG